jgi:hypothetical protein
MKKKRTEAHTEEIVKLAKSGVLLSRIAEQFHLSTGAVSKIARAHGIKRRPKFHVLSLAECREIRRRAADGEATAALAAAFSVSRVTVWRLAAGKHMDRRRRVESDVRRVLGALRKYPYVNKREISRRTGLDYSQIHHVCEMLQRRERVTRAAVKQPQPDTEYTILDWLNLKPSAPIPPAAAPRGTKPRPKIVGAQSVAAIDVLLKKYGVA